MMMMMMMMMMTMTMMMMMMKMMTGSFQDHQENDPFKLDTSRKWVP